MVQIMQGLLRLSANVSILDLDLEKILGISESLSTGIYEVCTM